MDQSATKVLLGSASLILASLLALHSGTVVVLLGAGTVGTLLMLGYLLRAVRKARLDRMNQYRLMNERGYKTGIWELKTWPYPTRSSSFDD